MVQLCGAKTKAGTPCRRPVSRGRTRCHKHGGKTPRGMALPQTIHGRYSKDLPTRLGERFLASQQDPDLLNLKAEIALLDARLGDLLRRVDSGESGETWRKLKEAYRDLELASRTGDEVAHMLALESMGELIKKGAADAEAWREVQGLVEQRRKLVETERKRLVEMEQLITTDQAMVLVTRLTSAVKRHVHDERILAEIAAEFGTTLEHHGA